MAAFMTNCVSKERVEVHKLSLFFHNTDISYRLKDKLEPDQRTRGIHYISMSQVPKTVCLISDIGNHRKGRKTNSYFASETFLSMTIDVPRSFTIRSSLGRLNATV